MPKIPIYERVTDDPIALRPEGINIRPDNSRQRSVQALGQLGKGVADMGARMEVIQVERDRLAAGKAYDAFYDANRELTLGEGGAFTKQGEEVLEGSTETLRQELEKLKATGTGELKNKRQQEAYELKVDALINRTLDKSAGHEAGQLRKSAIARDEADAHQYAEEIYADPGGPTEVFDELLSKGAEAKVQAERKRGVRDPQILANIEDDYVSTTVAQSIKNLSRIDPALAQERFEKYGELITDGEEKDQVLARLENDKELGAAQEAADAIWVEHEGDREAALAAARDIDDAGTREKALLLVEAQFADAKAIDEASYKQFKTTLSQKIYSAKSSEEAYKILGDAVPKLRGNDPFTYANLIKNQLLQPVTVTDPLKYNEARIRIDNGEITSADQVAEEYNAYMKPSDLTKTTKYFTDGGNVGGLRTSTLNTVFGRLVGKKPSERSAAYEMYEKHILSQLEPGKKLTDADLNQISIDYFKVMGESNISSIVPGQTEESRGQAFKAGRADIFRPWSDEEDAKARKIIFDWNQGNIGGQREYSEANIQWVIENRIRK